MSQSHTLEKLEVRSYEKSLKCDSNAFFFNIKKIIIRLMLIIIIIIIIRLVLIVIIDRDLISIINGYVYMNISIDILK